MCPCLSNNSNSEYMVNIHQLAVQRLEAIANRMETAQYGNQGIIYPKSTSEGGYYYYSYNSNSSELGKIVKKNLS